MTQVLTISTPFLDLAELTENFAQRVDEERLMLPYPEGMPEGEWIQFNVLLGDGNVALAGVGRVQGSYDNGEEHPAEYRFDVVLDSLQLEGMHEVMFERLMMARASMMGGEPVTGEVSVEELERRAAADAEAQQAAAQTADGAEAAGGDWDDDAGGWQEASEPDPQADAVEVDAGAAMDDLHADAGGYEDHGTGEVDVGDIEEMPAPARAAPAARPPAAPYPTQAREPGKLPSPHSFNGVALMRASLPATWSPEPALRPEAAQSSGYFDYQGGVPRPAHPPRPDLDPSQRVQAAPRPGAPWPRRPTGQHAIVESAGESDVMISEPAPAFEELGVDEALTTGDETAQVEAPAGDPEHEEW
jgi:hypothetical protein